VSTTTTRTKKKKEETLVELLLVLAHHHHKLRKIDSSVLVQIHLTKEIENGKKEKKIFYLADHLLHIGVTCEGTEALHNRGELFLGDLAIVVQIKQSKSVLEFSFEGFAHFFVGERPTFGEIRRRGFEDKKKINNC